MTVDGRRLLRTWADDPTHGYGEAQQLTGLGRRDVRKLIQDTLRLAKFRARTAKDWDVARQKIIEGAI